MNLPARCLPLLAAVVLGCGHGANNPTNVTTDKWRLVWQDEFDGPVGQLPDQTKWSFDTGGHGWGNNQLEYNTNRAENASLDGAGNLVITARKEQFETNTYTSARLKTLGLFEKALGKFEARIKLPKGRGLWPAFWLLGADFSAVGWPACGEIDIMEYRGQEPTRVAGSLHGPGYSGGDAVTGSFVVEAGPSFADDFHVFAIEWDSSRISYLVDGEIYQVFTPAQVPASSKWVFNHPFFVLLNLAVGGNYLGSPDASTVFPAAMVVDYVRAYERNP